jgi:hypothetical protein
MYGEFAIIKMQLEQFQPKYEQNFFKTVIMLLHNTNSYKHMFRIPPAHFQSAQL